MSQFGFLGSIIGGIVGGPAGWTVGGLMGQAMDRQEDERKIERHSYSYNDDQERILTINESQMTQLIKQALDECKTRGPFKNATFEAVGEGFVVSLNFEKKPTADNF